MPDDWSWFWATEHGRDNLLREELERTASASSAQTARLSSQLRTLQGSMESRLQALSTAFDAYVELGDVREQLAGHPDTSAVRRDVLNALTTLARGGRPERIDGRGVDYWLVDAANEVVEVASGGPSSPSSPGPGSQEHEMFVVAALGWLGRGELVSGRVAPLLVGDGALAAPQVLLWRAAVHGLLGDPLRSIRVVCQDDLDPSAAVWEAFVRGAAPDGGPVATLERVRTLLTGDEGPAGEAAAPAAAAADDDHAALRSLVDALVGAGLGDERALLDRARVLRARIEDPGATEAAVQAEPPRTTTTVLLQQALLDPGVSSGTRRTLASWVRPGLEAATREIAGRVAGESPEPSVARTEMGDAEVGSDGADPRRLAQLDALLTRRWSNPRSRLLVPGVAAGVLLVVGLVLLATRLDGLGVFLLVVAAALGVVLVRELLRARTRRAELARAQQRVRERVDQARAAAVAARSTSQQTKAQVAGLARAITEPVAEPVASAEPSLR